MQIIIDRKQLKAVSLFSASKDIRCYLNGVYVIANAMQTRMVATDGHTCGIVKRDARGENVGAAEFIIPSDAVKKILANKPARGTKGEDVTLTLPDDYMKDAQTQSQEIRASFQGVIVVFRAIEGKFPDYKRIIPSEVTGEAGHFDAEYLYRCKKASIEMGSNNGYYDLRMNGPNGAALARIHTDMVAVIMPYRGHSASADDAQWARESLP